MLGIYSATENNIKKFRSYMPPDPEDRRQLYVRSSNCSTSTLVVALRISKGVAQYKSFPKGKWCDLEPDRNHFIVE